MLLFNANATLASLVLEKFVTLEDPLTITLRKGS